MGSSQNESGEERAGRQFATTRWSMVVAAGRPESQGSKRALAELCATYWYPLYAFLRRQNLSAHDAQDTTQEFFLELLDRELLERADHERGRFRSFLLASMKHFLANRRRRARAVKRGAGATLLSLDFNRGEERYRNEPVESATPESIFERRWAMTVLELTLGRLEAEFAADGKLALFETLKNHLGGSAKSITYRDLAEQLGMTEGAVKMAVHRIRKRYRELLQAEVAQTVSEPDDIAEELRDLKAALGKKI